MKKTQKILATIIIFTLISILAIPFSSAGSTNLAAFPTGWVSDYPYGTPAPCLNINRETANTHNGQYTFKVTPTNDNRGLDTDNIPIKPGDKVAMRCWIKTEGAPIGETYGGKIGCDIYGSQAGICPLYSNTVQFGSNWALATLTFTVASAYQADEGSTGQNVYRDGLWVQPASLIAWCNINSPNWPYDGYTVYFSGFELTINGEALLTINSSGVILHISSSGNIVG